jgi:hypothetical protein
MNAFLTRLGGGLARLMGAPRRLEIEVRCPSPTTATAPGPS